MTTVLEKVNLKIGLEGDEAIKLNELIGAYDICRYDRAWQPNTISPWCALFDKDDLMVLEYHEELEYYYKNGYGYVINGQFGCPLIKDFAQILTNTSNAPDGTF